MFAQGAHVALRMTGTIVLARLLTPDDYGLVGMVTVVIGFVSMFKDAGLSIATVQEKEISHEQISTLFWLNMIISAILGLCILAVSPMVALFYGKPELTAITAALSISFIISGLTIQHQALQMRHMRFGVLAGIQIGSQIVTLAVTVILAVLGWRYWSLVGGAIAQALAGTLLTYITCPWVPGRLRRGTGIRGMLKFGGYMTGFNIISYFARNADNILIGRYIGSEALGLYGRAYDLFMMPISQIREPLSKVALPALSSLTEKHDQYAKYYRRLLTIITSLTIPITVYCTVEAEFIIRLALGARWLDAVPVFRVLALAGLVQPSMGTAGIVMLNFGYVKRHFQIGLANSLLVIASFVMGLPYGIIGVASAYAIMTYITFLPLVFLCFYGTPVTKGLFLGSHVMPLVLSLISIIPVFIARSALPDTMTAGHIVPLALFAGIYSISTFRRKEIRETISMFRGDR